MYGVTIINYPFPKWKKLEVPGFSYGEGVTFLTLLGFIFLMRIIAPVSAYPFHNVRYLDLLRGISRHFETIVVAGSSLGGSGADGYRVMRVLPATVPRRVRYVVGPYLSRLFLGLLSPDLVWLFDTAAPTPIPLPNKPLIADFDDPPLYYRHNDAYIMHRADRVVFPSGPLADRITRIYGLGREKIRVIPTGVDLSLFRPMPKPREKSVLYYGSFAPHRSEFLLAVIDRLRRMDGEIRYIIVGHTPHEIAKKLFSEMGLMGRTVLPGYIPHPELPTLISMGWIALFPQDRPLGGRLSIKLLEYMACGRPIVATDVDEAWPVREANSGVITPVDPDRFAEAVIDLLNDEEKARKLAENGVRYAQNFDLRLVIQSYKKLIEETIRGG
jgi:glycosyltransferase involved in cell wall biosynthesis